MKEKHIPLEVEVKETSLTIRGPGFQTIVDCENLPAYLEGIAEDNNIARSCNEKPYITVLVPSKA